MKRILLCALLLAFMAPLPALAAAAEERLEQFRVSGDFAAVKPLVVETTPFYGLAGYYNGVTFYRLGADGPETLPMGEVANISADESFAAVGRFSVLQLRATKPMALDIGDESFTLVAPQGGAWSADLLRKDALVEHDGVLDQLRYQHLWGPLASLSRGVEWLLVTLQSVTGLAWGWSIVLFSLVLKVLLLPLSIYAARLQASVGAIQGKLAPKLAEIKARYDGEEAHKRIMAAHKELGVSTFFSLKPLGALFLQVPVWIAVFNALGEMPQLVGQGFLWIENLSYPDSIATLPAAVPLLGTSISLLPVVMAGVTFASSMLLRDAAAPAMEKKRQTRNALFTALAFLLLFYPFPAAMVLYWTLSNALQIVQQKLVKTG